MIIDIENIDYVRLEDSLHCLEHHKGDEVECVICAPIVEAIPKDQYEARLKADMVAMLEEISLEIEELEKEVDSAKFAAGWICGVHDSLTVIKNRIEILKAVQKINALRGEQP